MKQGNIIAYMKKFGNIEEVVVTNIHKDMPEDPQVTLYPFEKSPRLFFINLPKNQQRYMKNHIRKLGDWYCRGVISQKDSKTLKRLLEERDSIVCEI